MEEGVEAVKILINFRRGKTKWKQYAVDAILISVKNMWIMAWRTIWVCNAHSEWIFGTRCLGLFETKDFEEFCG